MITINDHGRISGKDRQRCLEILGVWMCRGDRECGDTFLRKSLLESLREAARKAHRPELITPVLRERQAAHEVARPGFRIGINTEKKMTIVGSHGSWRVSQSCPGAVARTDVT